MTWHSISLSLLAQSQAAVHRTVANIFCSQQRVPYLRTRHLRSEALGIMSAQYACTLSLLQPRAVEARQLTSL